MWLTIMKLNGIGIIAFLWLFACTAHHNKQNYLEEEAYLKEVMKRRIQGHNLIQCGIFLSKDDSHQKVYGAMAKYYDCTDEFFASLLEDHPTLAPLEDDVTIDYTEINDAKLVEVLQMHVFATLQLYRGGIAKNIHDEYKNKFLLFMPALIAQGEDLKILQDMSEINKYMTAK